MAITITTQPATTKSHSAYQPLIYKITSNHSQIAAMRAVLNIDGFDVNSTSPIVLEPDITTTDTFTFDLQSFLADTLDFDVNHDITAATAHSNSLAELQVDFTEVIDSGTVFLTGSTDTSNLIDILNTSSEHNIFSEIDFLTFEPNPKSINESENEVLSVYFQGGYDIKVRVVTKDSSGSTIQTAEYTASIINSARRGDVPVGTKNLNSVTLLSGSQPLITDQVESYTIDFRKVSDSSLVSPVKTYNINRKCFRKETRVHFINRLGGVDSFTFSADHITGLDVDSEFFGKLRTLATPLDVEERGKKELFVRPEQKFTVFSQIMKRSTAEWLEELKTSPDVRVEDGTKLIPVIVIDKSDFEVSTNKRFAQVKLEYVNSNPPLIQRG